jgi:amino acid adenylation domain-containing protein
VVGDKKLVAYLVARQGESAPDAPKLRERLLQTLPDYMVPSHFVAIDAMPLSPNGKIDRKALPAPDLTRVQAQYAAPRNDVESTLCDLWQQILGLERIGITDNFFELGGHSLTATRLIARVNQGFGMHLPLKAIFEAQTPESLALLIVRQAPEWQEVRPALLAVRRDTDMPLSYAQQRLWLLMQIDGESAHYNVPAALQLDGVLHHSALCRAFATIVLRHESLRTTFRSATDGRVSQTIREASAINVPLIDLSTLPDAEQERHLRRHIAADALRPFDLARDLMLRTTLIRLASQRHVLLINMHHIASDGWSLAILANELSALYAAYVDGKTDPLPPLPIQYADYAYWQRNWMKGAVLERELGYWQRQLNGLPVVHSLLLDHTRPTMQSFRGATLKRQLAIDTVDALKHLCQECGATLFMGLHAIFSILLSRYSNEDDIVIGTPIANREQAEIAPLIGFFVNTLVLRSDLAGNPTLRDVLADSRQMLLEAYTHQQVPFEQVVERLQPARNLSHHPLFQIMLTLQNNEPGDLELRGLNLSPLESEGNIAKYDLSLNANEHNQGLTLEWEYNCDLFEEETIARMAQHFETLLTRATLSPQIGILEIDLLSDVERAQQLREWNAAPVPYRRELCLHQLFEEQVKNDPDAIALVIDEQYLSYGELNARANRLAHYLVDERGIGPDSLVGLCVDRSLDMIVAILGILKAGGAYVPLDPEYPAARLAYIAEDARLATVLTQKRVMQTLPLAAERLVCLDGFPASVAIAHQSARDIPAAARQLSSASLAYVIYTSGSTGNPKGTMIEHRSVINLVTSIVARYGLNREDGLLQFATVNFDMSVEDIFGALSSGCRLILRSERWMQSIEQFWQQCTEFQATVLDLPTAFWHELVKDASQVVPACVRHISVGGEALNPGLVEVWQRRHPSGMPRLFNIYGPTECTVDTTMIEVNGSNYGIGRALDNIRLYVLNPMMVLCPPGTPGELYVGGDCLARGYLNREDLTAEKFVPNPFHDPHDAASSERLYRTGDLVKWLPDGRLEFAGRIDHQVKIRGFRIELGEIDGALASCEVVKDGIVTVVDSADGDKRLVAYIVGHDEVMQGNLIDLTRRHLSECLPQYMLPAAYVVLDRLPLTPNGKIDRRALPEPEFDIGDNHILPRTNTEQAIAGVWRDMFSRSAVGIHDDFFALGGHSLMAVQFVSRIRQAAAIDLAVRDLFAYPTLETLAAFVDGKTPTMRHPNLVPIRPAKEEGQASLFLVHPIGGEVQYAFDLARQLEPGLAVYGLAASGLAEGETPHTDIAGMAGAYLDAVRQIQPEGPYRVAGWSLGGMIAYEMARQLQGAGETVDFVGMIDTGSPAYLREQAAAEGMVEFDESNALLNWVVDQHPELPGKEQSPWRELLALADTGNLDAMIALCWQEKLLPAQVDSLQVKRILAVYCAGAQAANEYQPQAGTCTVYLYTADRAGVDDTSLGWAATLGAQLQVSKIGGTHFSIVRTPHIEKLGRAISGDLANAAKKRRSTHEQADAISK